MMNLAHVSLNGNYKLDISSLKTGLYFIRINSQETQQIVKLVVE